MFSAATVSLAIGYGYNAQGQLFHLVLPSGKAITFGYNSIGQVTSVTLDGSPSTTILNNVTYDPFGPITGWTWGNGTASTSRTFDADGKLTQITSSGQRTFGYDDAFRITSVSDLAAPANSWTLGYDILDRLNSATKTGTTIGYTYDANGNRLTQTGTTASTYTVSATSNRLASVSGALVRTYGYNNAGSVTSSSATTQTYYNSGRMKTAKLGAASVTTYVYNALGQRVKRRAVRFRRRCTLRTTRRGTSWVSTTSPVRAAPRYRRCKKLFGWGTSRSRRCAERVCSMSTPISSTRRGR
jgi:YD repeat-containing protein